MASLTSLSVSMAQRLSPAPASPGQDTLVRVTVHCMPYVPSAGANRLEQVRKLMHAQAGVVATRQLRELGVSYPVVRAELAAGRWTRLSEGIYFLGNTRPGADSLQWAALLACGEGAVLSHNTAAAIYGFARTRWFTTQREVSIPEDRQEVAVPGVRVRRSRLLPGKATVYDGWPITTAADTVLDLVAEMRSPHDAVALLTDACRSKSVTAEEILKAMGRRKRQRHRQLVKDVLADVVGGVESILEHRYLVKVERAHGLPRGRRQVKARGAGGVPICRDVDYDEFDTVVELDGRLGHEGSGRHRDRRRDNAGTVGRKATLRYGHADLREPCETAAEVATVLGDRGWTGQLTKCGPHCTALR